MRQKLSGTKRTSFNADPRIDASLQLNQEFYNLRKNITEFEIGHMAANHEMAWGKLA
jgi:DNA/RNA endonuclease G (NUC1)